MSGESSELEGAEEHDHEAPVRLEDHESCDDGEEVGEEVFRERAVGGGEGDWCGEFWERLARG